MFLSALDPDLLLFKREDWLTEQPHFTYRIKSLAMHRKIIRHHNQKVAMSSPMAAVVCESFPWNDNYKHIPELRDLRQFVIDDLAKAHFITGNKEAIELSIHPTDITCKYTNSSVWDSWKELLYGCVKEEACSFYEAQIATWEEGVQVPTSESLMITVSKTTGKQEYRLALVWDEASWNRRLYSQDAWPDLQRCVQLYFKTNPAMQSYPGIREQPVPFEWTAKFWKSVDDFCQPNMRHQLIRAIAKKVYGMLDKGLNDEALGTIRRFRVTSFWRVHYRDVDGTILLEEFGEHDMGL